MNYVVISGTGSTGFASVMERDSGVDTSFVFRIPR